MPSGETAPEVHGRHCCVAVFHSTTIPRTKIEPEATSKGTIGNSRDIPAKVDISFVSVEPSQP
jgi:hypothetical protein